MTGPDTKPAAVNSANESGGDVPTSRYTDESK